MKASDSIQPKKRKPAFDALTSGRSHLDDLAQRIKAAAGWEDLALPRAQCRLLRRIAAAAPTRLKMHGTSGHSSKSARAQGVRLLFAGPNGTGKTLAAEVLGNALHLDLYRVDLRAVVSKYIGETEKNLDRIFAAAAPGDAILFFDEADVLFGKRSAVKDSHDRYANIEANHLLQRLEEFRGLAVVTINQKGAIDPAFRRRFQFVVPFPPPGA